MGDTDEKEFRCDNSRRTKGKQGCTISPSYQREMNRFLTIIYHNITRLEEDKKAVNTNHGVEHQLEQCGTPERTTLKLQRQNSAPVGYSLDWRTHPDILLRSSKCPCSSKSFKRKVTFSN